MKKLLLFVAAALIGVVANAQPQRKLTLQEQTVPAERNVFVKGIHPRWASTALLGRFCAPSKAAADFPIISEQPEGELKTFLRGGMAFQYNSLTETLKLGAQSGTIDIVFAEGNVVYLQNPLSTFTSIGSWVKGTLSDDGKTITLPLFQNLYYHANFDASLLLALGDYEGDGDEGNFVLDEAASEVTYTIEDDVITLNGTSQERVLGAFWSDDRSWQGYADYESVYTHFEPNTELVVLPGSVEAVDMKMTGKFFENAYASEGEDFSTTVKVGREGNDFYIQGLVQLLPEAWVKGEYDAATGTVEVPVTYLGEYGGGLAYVMGYSSSGPVPVKLLYDEDCGSLELDGYAMVSPKEMSLVLDEIYGLYTALFIGERPALVEVPENVDMDEVPFTALYETRTESLISGKVTVALDDDGNVYIKGLIQETPGSWIKGTFTDDLSQVIFPSGQYVGVGDYGSIYVLGAEEVDDGQGNVEVQVSDIVFDYDWQKNVMRLQNTIYMSSYKDRIYYYSALHHVVIGSDCDAVWVAGEEEYANGQDVTEFTIAADEEGKPIIGAVLSQGSNATNSPKYYSSDETLRLYSGNTMTITSEKMMGEIVIVMSGTEKQKRLEANVGEYALNGDDGVWTGEAKEVVFSVPSVSGAQARIERIKINYKDYSSELVEVPEGLVAEPYLFNGTDTYQDSEVTFQVRVGFSGDYVYFQGLSELLPQAWVRGTLAEDGTVSIPNWYLGVYQVLWSEYDVTFSGATFVYDKEADVFTSEEGYKTYAGGGEMDEFEGVTLTKLTEVAATPKKPVITDFKFNDTYGYGLLNFNIPTVGTNDEVLVTDKLSYQLLVEKEGVAEPLTLPVGSYTEIEEDMTEIPYGFTDNYDIYNTHLYLNFDLDVIVTWDRLGLQSIYRGLGEEHRSEICWYDLSEYWTAVGIETLRADKRQPAGIYDLQGRQLSRQQLSNSQLSNSQLSNSPIRKGLYIVNGRKVVVK